MKRNLQQRRDNPAGHQSAFDNIGICRRDGSYQYLLILLTNLAGLHQAMGDNEQALPLIKQALAIMEEKLGPEHPDTKLVAENLQLLLDEMNPTTPTDDT